VVWFYNLVHPAQQLIATGHVQDCTTGACNPRVCTGLFTEAKTEGQKLRPNFLRVRARWGSWGEGSKPPRHQLGGLGSIV